MQIDESCLKDENISPLNRSPRGVDNTLAIRYQNSSSHSDFDHSPLRRVRRNSVDFGEPPSSLKVRKLHATKITVMQAQAASKIKAKPS